MLLLRKYTDSEKEKGKNLQNYPIFFATSKLSFKDNSGNYIYAHNDDGNPILDNKGNPQYLTDLFQIAEAFIDWGKKQSIKGDKVFDYLNE